MSEPVVADPDLPTVTQDTDSGLPKVTSPAVAGAPSPAPAAPREPKPATVALATYDDLASKAKRVDDYVVNLQQDDGTVKQVRLHMEAIDGPAYEALQSRCPPTREQAVRQMNANPDTFEPLLLSAVVVDPKLDAGQWKTIHEKPEWSGGEWASLVMRAQALCMTGLDVPFNVGG